MTSFGVVIVGASLAGFRTAEALRRAGYSDRIALVGEELHLPYDRPPLSKKILTGESQHADVSFVDAAGITTLDLDLFLGKSAVGLDVSAKTLTLASGEVLGYEHAVIATGARARQPFTVLPRNVVTLRTIDDAIVLRKALLTARRLIIVGGGFIGFEVASSARSLGVEVVVIEAAAAPLSRSIGAETARLIAANAVGHGVELICSRTVSSFNGDDAVTGVTLDDGTDIAGDVVLVGVGSQPNSEWLDGSGLQLERGGVLCSSAGEAIGVEHVWAVGDVAAWADAAGAHARHEHWTSAGEQARVVAKNIVTQQGTGHAASAFVWSDQFGKHISIVGSTTDFDRVVFAAVEPTADDLAALYIRDDIVVGACIVGQPRLLLHCRRWVNDARRFDDIAQEFLAVPVPVAS